jgi:hypothetical protein
LSEVTVGRRPDAARNSSVASTRRSIEPVRTSRGRSRRRRCAGSRARGATAPPCSSAGSGRSLGVLASCRRARSCPARGRSRGLEELPAVEDRLGSMRWRRGRRADLEEDVRAWRRRPADAARGSCRRGCGALLRSAARSPCGDLERAPAIGSNVAPLRGGSALAATWRLPRARRRSRRGLANSRSLRGATAGSAAGFLAGAGLTTFLTSRSPWTPGPWWPTRPWPACARPSAAGAPGGPPRARPSSAWDTDRSRESR